VPESQDKRKKQDQKKLPARAFRSASVREEVKSGIKTGDQQTIEPGKKILLWAKTVQEQIQRGRNIKDLLKKEEQRKPHDILRRDEPKKELTRSTGVQGESTRSTRVIVRQNVTWVTIASMFCSETRAGPGKNDEKRTRAGM